MNKHWFVLYTRSNCEKKVSELLTKREIENYCPLNKVYRQWSDRKKIVDMPLFSSYVFVRVLEKELTGLKSLTSNIVNLVYWLGKPAVVKDQEIDNIKFFLNEYSNIKLEKRNVDINEDVLIMRGPFFNQQGVVKSIKNNSVLVSLPSLGYSMIAEIPISNVKILNADYEVEPSQYHSLSVC
ncbi:MAG: UpxY family transcription antiterminator [Chitinophagaceae bacterium]|jgi:transcription antitermination factor NusG